MVLITYGVLSNVFNIRVDNQVSGTCFYMPLDGRHYLVTAKHLFTSSLTVSKDIWVKGSWQQIDGRVICQQGSEIDIVAIEVAELGIFHRVDSVVYASDGTLLSAEAFFLGFPYGIRNERVKGQVWPAPLVKKAVISGIAEDTDGNAVGFYLDGHNNPGFSGGPCVTATAKGSWQIFGVVSSYLPQREILYDERGNERMVLLENSGIFVCHNIDGIIDEIRSFVR